MNVIALNLPDGTGADDVGSAASWSIGQNYPNPFSAHTELTLQLYKGSSVRVDVIDTLRDEADCPVLDNVKQQEIETLAIKVGDC
jgi:hypothetical protein